MALLPIFHFIAAHASRHPEPLVVVGYEPNGTTDQWLPSSLLSDIFFHYGYMVRTDFNKDSWVKQQSININISLLHVPNLAPPLLVLNDGRIAGHKENWAFILQDYNQNTIPMNEPHTKYGMTVGLCGGNLLSLENCMI
ncbi:hypothetical protein HU200_061478 [Digitaria exilis]|uniref:Uncharacterized protein n=1 Tax=Digitaria exilis TaxID=1010633 RepID=A0A835DY02_9POAL|nr:hypothetical protein HU200_061478 [Digitaria exilis]